MQDECGLQNNTGENCFVTQVKGHHILLDEKRPGEFLGGPVVRTQRFHC